MNGRSGIGMKKHGVCGSRNGCGKSPKLRLQMKMNAEKDERKAKPSTCDKSSIRDLFKA